jgi:hypothetical protein
VMLASVGTVERLHETGSAGMLDQPPVR